MIKPGSREGSRLTPRARPPHSDLGRWRDTRGPQLWPTMPFPARPHPHPAAAVVRSHRRRDARSGTTLLRTPTPFPVGGSRYRHVESSLRRARETRCAGHQAAYENKSEPPAIGHGRGISPWRRLVRWPRPASVRVGRLPDRSTDRYLPPCEACGSDCPAATTPKSGTTRPTPTPTRSSSTSSRRWRTTPERCERGPAQACRALRSRRRGTGGRAARCGPMTDAAPRLPPRPPPCRSPLIACTATDDPVAIFARQADSPDCGRPQRLVGGTTPPWGWPAACTPPHCWREQTKPLAP
jgi:hypothetical protein